MHPNINAQAAINCDFLISTVSSTGLFTTIANRCLLGQWCRATAPTYLPNSRFRVKQFAMPIAYDPSRIALLQPERRDTVFRDGPPGECRSARG